MKKFNLEEAKAGKPVITRDGSEARIICFDMKNDLYPIVALIEDGLESESKAQEDIPTVHLPYLKTIKIEWEE